MYTRESVLPTLTYIKRLDHQIFSYGFFCGIEHEFVDHDSLFRPFSVSFDGRSRFQNYEPRCYAINESEKSKNVERDQLKVVFEKRSFLY